MPFPLALLLPLPSSMLLAPPSRPGAPPVTTDMVTLAVNMDSFEVEFKRQAWVTACSHSRSGSRRMRAWTWDVFPTQVWTKLVERWLGGDFRTLAYSDPRLTFWGDNNANDSLHAPAAIRNPWNTPCCVFRNTDHRATSIGDTW